MKNIYLYYPGGQSHAFTLSYDDGVESDFRLAELMRRYGIRGTFNINSVTFPTTVKDPDAPRVRMTRERFLEFYRLYGDIVEIAAHGAVHGQMENMEPGSAIWEALSDRQSIETQLGIPCRGFAYPYGTYLEETPALMESCGFRYARTTKNDRSYEIPADPFRWACACRHKNPDLLRYADEFLAKKIEGTNPYLFAVWGHSYEFNQDNNWHVIEELFQKLGGRKDIWYATNLEYFEYIRAFRSLEFFVDQSHVYNPTAIPVVLGIKIRNDRPVRLHTVHPGELVHLHQED